MLIGVRIGYGFDACDLSADKGVSMDGRKEYLGAALADNIKLWNDIRENGGDDPFCEDGAVMNNIRKRIVMLKKRCEAELSKDSLPPEYSMETPPETKNSYMANTAQIKKQAKKILKAYEANDDYKHLVEQCRKLSPEQIRSTGIEYALHYPLALRFFIEKNRYVDMRRHILRPEKYMDAFKRYRAVAEDLKADGNNPESGKKEKRKKAFRSQPLPTLEIPAAVSHERKNPAKEAEKEKPRTGKMPDPSARKETKADRRQKAEEQSAAAGRKTEKTVRRARHRSLPEGQMSLFDIGIA